ncbi:DUF354 domain-containing protein [Thermococcus sp.]
MRILFNIAHPAQVHLFKNSIRILKDRGHDVKVTAVNKEVSRYLLGTYGIEYELVGEAKNSLWGKAVELLKIEGYLYRISREFRPDILVGGVGNVYVAHVGRLIDRPSIVFDDTEHAKIEHLLMDPFVTLIVTPSCYLKDLGEKQIRYNGYHELAYLHPKYFKPDPSVLESLGLSKGDTFFLLRFVSWTAGHDIGQKGIGNRIRFVKEIEKYGIVLISSEGRLNRELEKYRVKIPPEKIHDLLYYATLYVGEGATMASEAAVLGTPAVYVSSLARTMGNFIELEEKYGLVFSYNSESKALEKALDIIETYSDREWKEKRKRLIKDKIDVTKFIVDLIEKYHSHIAR